MLIVNNFTWWGISCLLWPSACASDHERYPFQRPNGILWKSRILKPFRRFRSLTKRNHLREHWTKEAKFHCTLYVETPSQCGHDFRYWLRYNRQKSILIFSSISASSKASFRCWAKAWSPLFVLQMVQKRDCLHVQRPGAALSALRDGSPNQTRRAAPRQMLASCARFGNF